MNLILGKSISERIDKDIIKKMSMLGKKPSIFILLANESDSSKTYTKLKKKKADEIGVNCEIINFSANCCSDDLLRTIQELNYNSSCHGIIVQLPLYEHLENERTKILNSISHKKDIDCLSETSLAKIFTESEPLLPAAAQATVECLKEVQIESYERKKIVIVNNSNLIGLPLAVYFSRRNASVLVLNEQSDKIEREIAECDILITATGKTKLFPINLLKEGSTCIDITSEKEGNKIFGDIRWDENVSNLNINITPVPGGVGPVTVSCVFYNLCKLLLENDS
ncbi:bifunctional 5,10-methylenetetrahydrofolate dehydrogenase/5,10-methenyltetrahydrofolate cyclohydrolase [Candidatus Dojkabacteria bacterium]|uniref:Bifunctional protein FolD n=1 Tax=Candidatus Dojkabacteria bacterium TaxID=2099670 RepID=A0A3M0Z463_9BACT|nr:MAG: bifunctional 5,10-methylenetetrahydrofolate dehydrogenase/5,10-methenyltetrahydrofolate cyclohydrolase [Candidatus Dojkabacteria bacterium]